MNIINVIIGTPLGYLLYSCYMLLGNYGVAIILFTMLTKLLMFPLSVWVQKNSIKMIRIHPEMNRIAASYAGNQDRIAEEQLKLYKRENYKPLAGMIPMLIQIPVILGLISVIYHPLQHILHLDSELISAFVGKASSLLGTELGSSAQIRAMELIKDSSFTGQFSALTPDAARAVAAVQALDMRFLGIDLSQTPSLSHWNILCFVPLLSAASAFILSWAQNQINVLQKEASWMGRWGMAIFLTIFSAYFAFIVPTGVGVYWIISNLGAIFVMLLVNWIIPPKKYIDYTALEESKRELAQANAAAKANAPTREQKARAKADCKKFCDEKNVKQLVFYSEKSGFYKYFRSTIREILRTSDVLIHYVTSDPNDAVFQMKEPRLVPYYIDDNRLIPLFMKMDADVVVMTMPDLQNYHLKRSYVRKDVKYVYMVHAVGVDMRTLRKGALDHYDTILCPGKAIMEELRREEAYYQLPPRNLVECGYSLIDEMIAEYEHTQIANENAHRARKQILIAPSYQEDNIMESCLTELLQALSPLEVMITVRPHPQYLKRKYGEFIRTVERCRSFENLHFETDFSASNTVFEADLLITDWSSIAYEYAFTTLKPVLFINTPMKIINPDYEHFATDIFMELRNRIGIALEIANVPSNAQLAVQRLLNDQTGYREMVLSARSEQVSFIGEGATRSAAYILDMVNKKFYKKK